MRVKYLNTRYGWTWGIYDGNGKLFVRCTRFYKRLSDAERAFQKLDRLF